MTVVPFSKIDPAQWERFVGVHPYGWLYHTYRYNSWSEALYRRPDFEPSFGFAIVERNEILGICPLILNKGHYLRPYLFGLIKHGVELNSLTTEYAFPLVSLEINPKRQRKVWKALIEEINRLCKDHSVDRFATRLIYPGHTKHFYDEMGAHFFKYGFTHLYSGQPRRAVIIDLSEDMNTILYNMDQDCRAAVKQAERNGITASEHSALDCDNHASDALNAFHKLHQESWARTGLTAYPLDYFVSMISTLSSDNVRLYIAYNNKMPVAAALIHRFKDAAIYHNGCSTEEGYALRANNLLQWKIMESLKEDGCNFYELGIFNTSVGQNIKEYSVGQFKAQFSKQTQDPIEWVKDISPNAAEERYLRSI